MAERYVHTIWCDDVRQEIGNKPSFMGVYTGGIVLPSLPTVLPRLAAYSWIASPINEPLKTMALRVVRDDGVVLVDMPSIETPKENAPPAQRPDATRVMAMVGIVLNSVEIPEGCRYLKILVDTESSTLEGTKLYVDVNPEFFLQMNSGYVPESHDTGKQNQSSPPAKTSRSTKK